MNPRLEFLLSLTDKISDPLAKIHGRFQNLQNMAAEGWGKLKAGTMGLAGSAFAAVKALEPAREVAARLGEVASLDVPIDELQRLERTALYSAVKYGVAADKFVEASYDIQSSMGDMLKQGELAGITDIASTLAVGTKAQIDTMTGYIGKMNGIFKQESALMGAEQWTRELAAMTATAVKKFTTDGEQMSAAFSKLGATAKSFGIDVSEQIAVLGKLQTTMTGSEAATKYQAFLNGAGKAQAKLGLSFVDSQGKMLGVVDILEKIQGKYGDLSTLADSDLIQKAFGTKEASALIKLLGQDVQALSADIDQIGQSRDFSAVDKMASAIADPFDKAGQAVSSITAKLGAIFLPQVNAVMDKFAAAGGKVLNWIDANPKLAKTLTQVGIGVGMVVAGVSALAIVIGTAMLASAGFGMVMGVLFSPILLIVGAVAALAAGAYYLYTRWDEVVAYLGNTSWGSALLSIFDGISSVIKTVLLVAFAAVWWAVDGLIGIAKGLYSGWSETVDALSDTAFGQFIVDAFTLITSPIESIKKLFGFLEESWEAVKSSLSDSTWGQALLAVIDVVTAPLRALISAWEKVKGFAGEKIDGVTGYASEKLDKVTSFASESVSSVTSSVSSFFGFGDESPTPAFGGPRALGGPVLPEHFYRVNEHGPELLETAGRTYLMTGGSTGNIVPFPSVSSSANVSQLLAGDQHFANSSIHSQNDALYDSSVSQLFADDHSTIQTRSVIPKADDPGRLNVKTLLNSTHPPGKSQSSNGKQISIAEVHIHSAGKLDANELKMMLEQAYGG